MYYKSYLYVSCHKYKCTNQHSLSIGHKVSLQDLRSVYRIPGQSTGSQVSLQDPRSVYRIPCIKDLFYMSVVINIHVPINIVCL